MSSRHTLSGTSQVSTHVLVDLDAPVLPAYEEFVGGSVYWLVWCDRYGKQPTMIIWGRGLA